MRPISGLALALPFLAASLPAGLVHAQDPIPPTTTPPHLLDARPEAAYPTQARRLGLEGAVTVRVAVAADGRVTRVVPVAVEPGGLGFEDAAVEAVSKWRFQPATAAGRHVAGTMEQPLTFRLTTDGTWPGARVFGRTSAATAWRAVQEELKALKLKTRLAEKDVQVAETRETRFDKVLGHPPVPRLDAPYLAESFALWVFVPPGIEPARVHVLGFVTGFGRVGTGRRMTSSGLADTALERWFLERVANRLGDTGEPLKSDTRARGEQLRRLTGGTDPCARQLADRDSPAWQAMRGAAAAAATHDPLEVDCGDLCPALLRAVQPEYPVTELAAKNTGTTVLELLVLEDGSAQDVRRAPGGPPSSDQFDAASVQAGRRWAFRAPLVEGCPVPTRATIEMAFTLRK